MFSGRYPSEIEMEGNDNHKKNVPQNILDTAMGNIFCRAEYETVYGGKIHLPGPSPVYEKVEPYGFKMRTSDYRDILADDCIEFLRQPHEKPFLMIASFVNPHDICYYALNEYNILKGKPILGHRGTLEWDACVAYRKELEGLSDEEIDSLLPELPENYEIPSDELACFQLDKPDFMCWARKTWGEKEWRLLRYFYKKFVERVDAKIGRVLDEIYSSRLEENTLVIFTSDHGDMGASHRTDEKGYLYEECCNVPLIMIWKDKIKPGQVDSSHLVSSGIDIIPTMCEAAGIEIPSDLEGKSLLPLATGEQTQWRDYLLVENNYARLIHFGEWKYMVSSDRTHPERDKCIDCSWDCRSHI
jgi:choline-sulfatase